MAVSTAARHARTQPKRHRVLWIVLSIVAVLLVGTASALFLAYRHLEGNIASKDVSNELGQDRPQAAPVPAQAAKSQKPVNILVMGSDSREGDNSFVGGDKDVGRSDTTILLHLSADRSRAIGVSIPRDSMVEMPTCVSRKGNKYPAGFRMFNEAYTIGGPGCVQRTVEQLTDIRIDHYVVIDFAGFRDMVDALGSVEVCLPKAIDDRAHNIHLPAGRNKLDGKQSLQYVRARYLIDGTGDIGRMTRQQTFISSVIQQATQSGMLANPFKLYNFLDAATKSITTDPQLASLNALRKLAQDVHGIGLDNIDFLTVPWGTYAPDPNRVVWTSAADQLWELIRQDKALPGSKAAVAAAKKATPTPSATPTDPVVKTAPENIRVRVLNGSGLDGAATQAAEDLRAKGFNVVSIGTAKTQDYATSLVRYNPSYNESARTLTTSVIGATSKSTTVLSRTLELVVGRDYTGLRDVRVAKPSQPPTPTPTFTTRTAATDICS